MMYANMKEAMDLAVTEFGRDTKFNMLVTEQ